MIIAVCLNPALDVTYDVPHLEVGAAQRVRRVTRRAGGKGVNVASVLHQQGADTVVVGPLGGTSGDELATHLEDQGIAHDLLHIGGSTRQTVTVVSDGAATVLNEPGPVLNHDEWAAFTQRFADLVTHADIVTMSGSLPGGVPSSAYAELVDIARGHRALTILDCEGAALVEALPAAPDIVKINEHEAATSSGVETTTVDGVFAAADALHARGAAEVVVTRGAAGVAAWTREARFIGTSASTVTGNPTGAGDAFTAGLAASIAAGDDWPTRLRRASAWAAAAVAKPTAGELDLSVASSHETDITTQEHTQ